MLCPCRGNPAWFSKLWKERWSERRCVPGSRLLCAGVSPVDSLVCLISVAGEGCSCVHTLSCNIAQLPLWGLLEGNLTGPVHSNFSLWRNCLLAGLSAGLGLKSFCILWKWFDSYPWCLQSFHYYSVCKASSLWIYICATKLLWGRNGVTPIFCWETEAGRLDLRPSSTGATDYWAAGVSDGLQSPGSGAGN